MRILIKDGRVVCPKQNIDKTADLVIKNGKIEGIYNSTILEKENFDDTINAKGLIVAPGLIDMHVHLRVPGHEGAETLKTGTMAAVSGGFTSLATMANTKPVNDNAYVTAYIKNLAQEEAYAKIYPIGAITENLKGEVLAEIGEMKKEGIVAVSDDGFAVMDSYVMRNAMEYAKQFNLPIIDHCEDINLKGQGVMNEGYYSMKLGLRGVPSVSEYIMVARDIALAEHTGAHIHIAHVSSATSARLIKEAKNNGVKVTAEVTPHHLFLTEEAVKNYDPNTKVNPPLRTNEDAEALKKALLDGYIDAIATDHAPHSIEKKSIEFQLSKSGMIGLETSLALSLKLVKENGLSMINLMKIMSQNPAKILNIAGGSLEQDAVADIVIFDPDERWVYKEENIVSKSKNSPFIDWDLEGKVKYTLCNGEIVYKNGEENVFYKAKCK